jgi:AGCS family alanine or glycine:cation symporter
MILCTGLYGSELGGNYVAYTQEAIDTVFRGWGSSFVAVSLAFFAFTTLMAYYFYAESSLSYLFETGGHKSAKAERIALWIYRGLLFTAIIGGACTQAGTAWTIGDIGVGLTTWINVIALLILCPKALQALRELEQKK